MPPTIEEQIEALKRAIAETEAQRSTLGDELVDSAQKPYRRKLDELTALLAAREESLPAEPAQQRKLVTLLFMDIAGSTSIAQHMDPEDVGEVFDVTLKKLAQPVEAHGGHVTRFMGDGFLAVFGATQAREDDPEQAVRAGLEIIELSSELAAQLQTEWGIPNFQVRAGVNTGLVLLGGETEAEDTLMGAAVNLAARLESAAPPGGLLVSHDTYRHIRGVFDVEIQSPIQVKGFDEPVQTYRILRSRPRAFRIHTRGVEGVETRMVGRETELKYLQDALLTAIEEHKGQMVTITGEAGVGKSRLLYEFDNWIDLLPPPHVRYFEGRAHQEAQGSPYALLRNLFEFRFQIKDDDTADAAREKIEAGLKETFGEADQEQMQAHILGQLLGFDFNLSRHLKGVVGDAEQLSNRGLIYLSEYFKRLCTESPVVILLEDIHWADDSSLDALNWLVERLQHQRLLVVCAARPTLYERRPYWGEGLAFHHRLNLEPLSRRESRQLVADILKFADKVPPELYELVVEGAEGNPFYLEELIKMLVEDGVIVKGEETWQIHPERLKEIEVPQTLAGVLQARLDSLPAQERAVLQQASVVGRLFWDRIVAHIQAAEGGRPHLVAEVLTSLRGREMVYRREASAFIDANEYLFKHDILREVTYESVLKRLRRRYHSLVADWLIAQVVGRAAEYNAMIAEHLLLADRKGLAIEYFQRAGESALASYANDEAESHFRKALQLSPEPTIHAACLAGLGEALGRQGHREEAEQVFRQAIELYADMEEYDWVAHLYTRLSQMLWATDYQRAFAACREALEQLESADDSPGLAYLLAEASRTAYFLGQPREKVLSLSSQAIAIAERLGIVEAQLEARITRAFGEGNLQQLIPILQEAAKVSEAHGLLRTAARAYHNLAHYYYASLGDLFQSYQYALKANEFRKDVGTVDDMFVTLWVVVFAHMCLGNLETAVDFAVEFLHGSGATEEQIEKFRRVVRTYLSFYRGDWTKALEHFRQNLQELHAGDRIQDIALENLFLADNLLDLYQFAGQDHLTEAEAALLENINIKWHWIEAFYMLALTSAHKGLFREAHSRLAEVQKVTDQDELMSIVFYRWRAEAELYLIERRWDEAVSAFQNLIDFYQRGGYRWEWARRLISLGDALVGRDHPGDRQHAIEAYRQSLELFTEMGATGYVQVLEQRLGEIG